MADKLKTIVVRLKPNHPNGKRNRAGFSFSPKPTAVEVSPEQIKLIEADNHLLIITKGEAVKQAMKELKAEGDANKANGAEVSEGAEKADEEPKNDSEATPDVDPVPEPVEAEASPRRRPRGSK